MEWVSTSKRLPELGQWVLARHNRGTWHDEDPNVICVVVKRVPDSAPTGNNLRIYKWQPFGPVGSFYGQEIDWWMEIPSLPDPQLDRIKRETEAELLSIRICDKCLQRLPDAPKSQEKPMREFAKNNTCPKCGSMKMVLTFEPRLKGPGSEEVQDHIRVRCSICRFKFPPMKCADEKKESVTSIRELENPDEAPEMERKPAPPTHKDMERIPVCPSCHLGMVKTTRTSPETYSCPRTGCRERGREYSFEHLKSGTTILTRFYTDADCVSRLPREEKKEPPVDLSNPEWDAAMSGVANKGITRTDQLKEKADKKQKLDEGERWAAVDRKNRELDERERRLAEREGGEKDDGVPMCPVCGLEMLRKDSVGLCTNKTCPVASKRLIMTAMGYRVQMGKLEEGEKELAARTAKKVVSVEDVNDVHCPYCHKNMIKSGNRFACVNRDCEEYSRHYSFVLHHDTPPPTGLESALRKC